jgi:hypothetical protein
VTQACLPLPQCQLMQRRRCWWRLLLQAVVEVLPMLLRERKVRLVLTPVFTQPWWGKAVAARTRAMATA